MSNKVKGIPGFEKAVPRAVNVGHGNFVMTSRIVAILESGSMPVRRLRDNAAKGNFLVDATAGRKTRSIIVTTPSHVVLSALAPQTLYDRLQSEGPQSGAAMNSAAQFELEEGEFVS